MSNNEREKIGDYEVIKLIGRGNFGTVHLVKRNDGEFYVMKRISVDELSSSEREGAEQEVELLKRISHPCIVKYIDSFTHKNILHLVMTYCDGGDLASKIRECNGKFFPEETILDWFVQLCTALKYCHDNRIIHRDIKSQNIFLMKNLKIRVGDFGIARVLNGTNELAMSVVGTPYSMSPEVCENKPYSFSSDIWALGCVLYELCVLKHAFDANNLLGLVWKIVQETYPPIPEIYSDDLSNLISNMLNKDPKKRPTITQILSMDFLKPYLKAVSKQHLRVLSSGRRRKSSTNSGPPRVGSASPSLNQSSENLANGFGPSGTIKVKNNGLKLVQNNSDMGVEKVLKSNTGNGLKKINIELDDTLPRKITNDTSEDSLSPFKKSYERSNNNSNSVVYRDNNIFSSNGQNGLSKKDFVLNRKMQQKEIEAKKKREKLMAAAKDQTIHRINAKQKNYNQIHNHVQLGISSSKKHNTMNGRHQLKRPTHIQGVSNKVNLECSSPKTPQSAGPVPSFKSRQIQKNPFNPSTPPANYNQGLDLFSKENTRIKHRSNSSNVPRPSVQQLSTHAYAYNNIFSGKSPKYQPNGHKFNGNSPESSDYESYSDDDFDVYTETESDEDSDYKIIYSGSDNKRALSARPLHRAPEEDNHPVVYSRVMPQRAKSAVVGGPRTSNIKQLKAYSPIVSSPQSVLSNEDKVDDNNIEKFSPKEENRVISSDARIKALKNNIMKDISLEDFKIGYDFFREALANPDSGVNPIHSLKKLLKNAPEESLFKLEQVVIFELMNSHNEQD